MNTTPDSKQVKIAPFKTARGAQRAMAQAEKAYENANQAAGRAYREALTLEVDSTTYVAGKYAARDQAWAYAEAVYNQAQAQGLFVKSWHFGVNPTRDLIAANMD